MWKEFNDGDKNNYHVLKEVLYLKQSFTAPEPEYVLYSLLKLIASD